MSKKQESETAVVEKPTTEVASVMSDLSEWGTQEISSRDVIIPKILAMQGLSDLVTEGKAKFGDFVDSVTQEVLGSIDKPIEFVPFHCEKVWIISERKVGTDKYEFLRYEDVKRPDQYPFTEVVGDTEFKYEYTMQFYVLTLSDPSMPKVISFKSTSGRTGKVLHTQMYVRNRAAGLVPAAYVMELGGKREKNDKGTFVVMEVKPKRLAAPELVEDCLNWLKIVKAGNTKVASEETAPSADYVDEKVKF